MCNVRNIVYVMLKRIQSLMQNRRGITCSTHNQMYIHLLISSNSILANNSQFLKVYSPILKVLFLLFCVTETIIRPP